MEQVGEYQRGNRHLVAGDYEAAIACFLRHAGHNAAERASAYERVAECYLRSNALPSPQEIAEGVTVAFKADRVNAEKYYRLALEVDPVHFAALRGLAHILPAGSEERLALFQRAASVQPNSVLFVDIGDHLRTYQKDYMGAYDWYRKAQELQPRYNDAYKRLNQMCRRLGRVEEALEWSAKMKAMIASVLAAKKRR